MYAGIYIIGRYDEYVMNIAKMLQFSTHNIPGKVKLFSSHTIYAIFSEYLDVHNWKT